MERSTGLFIADKLNVLRTMLRERPNDREALQEEIELESAARRYEQFYICLLDERNQPLLMTPGMAERLDLEQLTRQTGVHLGRTIRMTGRQGRSFRVTSATAPVGSPPTHTDTIQVAIDVSQQEHFLAALPALVRQHSSGHVRRLAAPWISNRSAWDPAGRRHGGNGPPH